MLFTRRLVSSSLLIAVFYLLFVVYIMNFVLINDVLTSGYPLFFKIKLFSALIIGIKTTMTTFNLFLLTVNALLTGIVLSLTFRKIMVLKKMGNIHLVAGGSSVLGIVSGGCVSCGLPLLSLFGVSGALLYLPFKGAELPFISLALLSFSLFFLIKASRKEEYCEVPKKRKK